MQNLKGVGVSPGRIIGTVRHMPQPVHEPHAEQLLPPDVSAEDGIAQLKAAAAGVHEQLRNRASHAQGDAKAVLEATALMAKDSMLLKTATKKITAGISAERAIWEAGQTVATQLGALGGYMAERATDVLDVRQRIVAELRGAPAPGIPHSDIPFILVAPDLAPADTATLDPAQVLALLTSEGGPQSHTTIIARALGIPAVVAAAGAEQIPEGAEIYVDGATGEIHLAPGQPERQAAERWQASAQLQSFDGAGATADGHAVPLLANVGGADSARRAAADGAQGVGLFRTEFCFLERDSEPSVEEQAAAYAGVFDAFAGKKVVVRTLDAGADKPLPFLTDSTEPNPALGVRGYRTDWSNPGVLQRQLQAIAQAAAGSNAEVWVMAPMISTVEDSEAFARMCADSGLRTPGVMIEVPSAALNSRHVLQPVQFASLGTNDLTQYAMAADRQLGSLAALNTGWQPAVLQLVKQAVDGAQLAGQRPVGVCGESAGDPAMAVVLVGLGVATLSMSARSIPAVSSVLRSVNLAQAQELAEVALNARTAQEAQQQVRAGLPILDQLGL
ncbi:phosphoenolpyruvate--protein phosphotransferase [Glutamicibacter sp. JL.03c]|uniref:phosphoenolpyruvate--protein phosphotransferase n=1 Tax=Glutamicibacter sp. JL.03c TaxID=2984842 RepID=UPI0021F6B3EB|nr:phosphoenolpyruvate--protein phosphotransferase [Glutamicibacter sp. JL.03c]UYQ76543.1 phosphoenolpyruvate--protein phosphotransferase [Glutamicibacter sp. JL.03c]